MWGIKQIHGLRQQRGGCKREGGGGMRAKEGLIYGDRGWFGFRWWVHSALHRSSIVEIYT